MIGWSASVRLTIALTFILIASTAAAQRDVIPFDEPDVIVPGESRFVLPDPDAHRVDLGDGLVAFVAEDANTSTVELTALIGASRLDDPEGKTGLAAGVAYAMRRVDGLTDALYETAATLEITTDNEHTRLQLSLLNDDLERGITLLGDMLRRPPLDDAVLAAYRMAALQAPWNENDPRRRPEFELPRILYSDHPAGRTPTTESVAAISVSDLRDFHNRYYVPNNVVLAVSGGLDRDAAVEALKSALFPWERARVRHPDVPPVTQTATPRKIHVWDVDRLQGWMLVGHLGRLGREEDHAALEVANYILGGNGAIWKRVHPELAPARAEGHFDARLFVESRGKRGLSNDISSYVPVGFRARGLAYAVTPGRPEAIAYLLKIIDDGWREIRADVSDEEVSIAKDALSKGYFQMRYAGAHATALTFAEELLLEGGHEWSEGYVERIQGVTKDEVLAAARKYFRPEELVAVLVGPIDEIRSSEHPLYKAKLEEFGEIVMHEW
jgi:zinc protease